MMFKQTSFVDLSSLKFEINTGEYCICITSQGGKAHGSCEPHLGIVKHFKEHGNISCCVRSRSKVPIESVKVVGYLGSNANDGCFDLLNINDVDMMKPFCKRTTHSGYRIASLTEKEDGTKEVDYSGRFLKTNEPFELDIFSISNSATSVIYCIIATIDAPDAIDGELVKIVSVPLCVHAKKSSGPVLSDLMVYQSSTSLSSFLTNSVVTSSFLSVAPDHGLIVSEGRYKHTVDWSGKSVVTTSLSGNSSDTEVYTLSKERQNGQRKSKEARTVMNNSHTSRNKNPTFTYNNANNSGFSVDYNAINASFKNEPYDEPTDYFAVDFHTNHSSVSSSVSSSHAEVISDSMEAMQVSRIIREELQSCLVNITRRLNSVGIRSRDSLRSVLRNNHTTHQSDLFSLQLLLSCIESTDVESVTGSSVNGSMNSASAAAAAVSAVDYEDDLIDDLLSLCGDDFLALSMATSCASIAGKSEQHHCVTSSTGVAAVAAASVPASVASPYLFGQTAVLAALPSSESSSGRADMKRQREDEPEPQPLLQQKKEQQIVQQKEEQKEEQKEQEPKYDLMGYYHHALTDGSQFEGDVAAVTSALKQLSADGVNATTDSSVEEVVEEEQSTPQKKLQKSKSNSNVCDYSRKCHV